MEAANSKETHGADPLIEDLVACELLRFSANDYRGLPGSPAFELAEGSVPVMVSAPFTRADRADEVSARRNPDPEAVQSCVQALADLIRAAAS